jgi:hypothetical protein
LQAVEGGLLSSLSGDGAWLPRPCAPMQLVEGSELGIQVLQVGHTVCNERIPAGIAAGQKHCTTETQEGAATSD